MGGECRAVIPIHGKIANLKNKLRMPDTTLNNTTFMRLGLSRIYN